MKKVISVVLLCAMCCCLISCNKKQADKEVVKLDDISQNHRINSDAVYWPFSFDELQEEADVIARVQVMDELTSDNTHVQKDDEGHVALVCSAREVKLLEAYKDTIGLTADSTFLVQDDAGIYLSDGEYIYSTINDAVPLVKGDTYILYLQKQANSIEDILVIMSGYNGMIHLENPYESPDFTDIVDKTFEKYNIEK